MRRRALLAAAGASALGVAGCSMPPAGVLVGRRLDVGGFISTGGVAHTAERLRRIVATAGGRPPAVDLATEFVVVLDGTDGPRLAGDRLLNRARGLSVAQSWWAVPWAAMPARFEVWDDAQHLATFDGRRMRGPSYERGQPLYSVYSTERAPDPLVEAYFGDEVPGALDRWRRRFAASPEQGPSASFRGLALFALYDSRQVVPDRLRLAYADQTLTVELEESTHDPKGCPIVAQWEVPAEILGDDVTVVTTRGPRRLVDQRWA